MLIKQIPGDFIVEEISNRKFSEKPYNYLIYSLEKINWDSFKIISALANALNSKPKFIGFAGNKDKLAVTKQFISFYNIPKYRIDNIKINDVKLIFVGYSNARINLGDLKGNNFIITVRKLKNKSEVPNFLYLENYFDDQRFGNKHNTHLIGKALVKRDFKKACEILSLDVKNNDYLGALRISQRRLLRFYLSSYQSFIFNNILSEYISSIGKDRTISYSLGSLNISDSVVKNFKIPLISFDSVFPEKIKKIVEKILNEEKIKPDDFIFRELTELNVESAYRNVFLNVNNIKCEFYNDELNKGYFKAVISFFLPKGAYATLLIKKLETYLK